MRPYFFVKNTRKIYFAIAIIGEFMYNIIEAQKAQ